MLSRLSIRDIVLIDRLDIDFAEGLAVLTGETGAGKSILLDCFRAGARRARRRGLVRQGVEQGQVIAAFDLGPSHPARATAQGQRHRRPDDELILRRVQFADGRTRAFVNDQPVSVQVLKSLGAALVEIHGQHDDRALVDAATHRRLLDAFARAGSRRRQGRGAVGGAPRGAGRRRNASRRGRARQARGRLAAPCGRGTQQTRRRKPARKLRSPSAAP